MSNEGEANSGSYKVGYGKPPKHSQFVKGQSGFKGRRKKRPETHAEMIARVRDEPVMINGKAFSKFELAVVSVFNQTIKSGKPHDLKLLFDLLEKHGAMSAPDVAANMKAGADAVMEKILNVFDRTFPDDIESG